MPGVIDLSQLPPPRVLDPLDFETILTAMAADFRSRFPDHDALVESDPAWKLLEVAAYRELTMRWRINEAAKSVLLAFAAGGDLDQLTALVGVTRQAGESDERLRRRHLLALRAFGAAGPPDAYEALALEADERLDTATVSRPIPGTVRVVLGVGGGALPTPALVTAVETALDAPEVRPVTDVLEVLAQRNLCYQVAVALYVESGPDRDVVRAAAEAAVGAYLLSRSGAGVVVYRSAVSAAAHVPGVEHADVTITWQPGTVVAGDAIDPSTAAIKPAWQAAAALWPADIGSIVGISAVVGTGIVGYEYPATAPFDGLTVTLA